MITPKGINHKWLVPIFLLFFKIIWLYTFCHMWLVEKWFFKKIYLKERKLNGEQVDSKNIKKHKNDVFRLAQLITANTRQVLSSEIAEDMKKFLSEIADETVDLKSLGIRGTDKQKIIDMLYLCYNLNDNT